MNALLNQAKTGSTVDQTKEPERKAFEIIPAGPTPARFVGYVEVGKHPQEFDGKAKADALEVILTFELNGKKHHIEYEKDGETIKRTNIKRETMPAYTASKAGFKKLFNSMRAEREEITHMAQMLNEPFLITVVHNADKTDPTKVYANIKDDNGWRVGPPIYTPDPLEPGITKILPVAEATVPLQLLLWDNPTKEQWDSIFIDGIRTVKKDGKEVEVSKNWVQERCLAAKDYESSALADMLSGADSAIADVIEQVAKEKVAEPEKKEAAKSEEKKPDPVKEKEPDGSADDILAALGLNS